jgi:hypothetical protein
MLNLCDILAAILKMVTGRKFSMSGINSGHHGYQNTAYKMGGKNSTLSDVIQI